MAKANSAAASGVEIKRRSRASHQPAEYREREREMLSRIRMKIERARGKAQDSAREMKQSLLRGDARRHLLREWFDSLGLAFRPVIASQIRHELQRLMTGMERNEIELQVAEFEASLKNKIELQFAGFEVSVKNVIDPQVGEFDVSLKNEIEVQVAEFEVSLIKERVCKRLKERIHESNNDIPKHFDKSPGPKRDGVKLAKERITINSLTSNAQVFCGLCSDKHQELPKNNDTDPPFEAYKAPPARVFYMAGKQADEGGKSEIGYHVKKDTAPSRATDSTCETERRLDGSPRMSAPVTFAVNQAADFTTMPPLILTTMHGGKSYPHNRNPTPGFSSIGNKRSSLADREKKSRATAAAPGGERFNLSGPHPTPAALATGGGGGMAWRAMSISERVMRATGTRDDIVGMPPLPAPAGPGSLRDTTMIRMTMAHNPNLREGRTMNVGRLRSSRSATGQNSRVHCGKNDDDVADILLSLRGRKRPLSEEQVVETEMIKRHIKDRVKEIAKRKISL